MSDGLALVILGAGILLDLSVEGLIIGLPITALGLYLVATNGKKGKRK